MNSLVRWILLMHCIPFNLDGKTLLEWTMPFTIFVILFIGIFFLSYCNNFLLVCSELKTRNLCSGLFCKNVFNPNSFLGIFHLAYTPFICVHIITCICIKSHLNKRFKFTKEAKPLIWTKNPLIVHWSPTFVVLLLISKSF